MSDRPFISRELDRRTDSAQAAVEAGRADAATANAGLMPWAAAEAWLIGQPSGISPRDGLSTAADICCLHDTIAELARARDALAAVIEKKGRIDLVDHWRQMADAVRRLERQRDGNQALRSAQPLAPPAPPANVSVHEQQVPSQPAQASMRLSEQQPSLLADMFDAQGRPLPASIAPKAA